jgi:hypothetical protein
LYDTLDSDIRYFATALPPRSKKRWRENLSPSLTPKGV